MSVNSAEDPHVKPERLSKHWTLLVLTPSGFYNKHSALFPTQTKEIGPGWTHSMEEALGRLSQPGAELKFIGQGLGKISERWAGTAYCDMLCTINQTRTK